MEFKFILLSLPLVWSTPLAFPCDVAYACTNIQQVVEEEEEEEGDTPHMYIGNMTCGLWSKQLDVKEREIGTSCGGGGGMIWGKSWESQML